MRSDSERITSHFKINAGKIFANIVNYSEADSIRFYFEKSKSLIPEEWVLCLPKCIRMK